MSDKQLSLELLLQSFNKMPENVDLNDIHKYCTGEVKDRLFEQLDSIFATEVAAASDKSVCGHVFGKGEGVYRCKDCGYDDTCVMCSQCFHATSHEGHEVFFSVTRIGGGMCDCGDSEAWKAPLLCGIHSPQNKLEGSHDSDKCWAIMDSVDDTETVMIAYLLDYCIFVMALWNSIAESPLDLTEYGKNPSEESLAIQLNYDRDDGDLDIGLILWNDEFHSYNEVIDSAVDALGCSEADAHLIAEQIDKEGRMMINASKDTKRMISQSKKFRSIGLATSFSTILGYIREQVVSYILVFALKKCNASPTFRRKFTKKLFTKIGDLARFSEFARNSGEFSAFTSHISRFRVDSNLEVLISISADVQGKMVDTSDAATSDLQIFDLLLIYDTKNWKRARQNSRKLLVSTVLHYKDTKLYGAIRFSRLYRELVKLLINTDREPDLSMIYLSVQLFTSPSVASILQQNTNALHVFLAALEDCLFAATGAETVRLNKSFYTHIFHDISYILSPYKDPGLVESLRYDEVFLKKYIDFICRFQGLDGCKREKHHHVEYESTAWRKSFELMYFLANNIKLICDVFSNTEAHLAGLVKLCVDRQVANDSESTSSHSVANFFNENECLTLSFHKVSEKLFSFHNPLNWFLGNLIVNAWRKPFAGNNVTQLTQYLDIGNPSQLVSAVYEKSLITQVAIAQCKAGLWVRNGWSFKGQVENYTHTFIRGETWDMELAVIQACSFILPVDEFLLETVDKFEVNDVFRAEAKSDFDPEQTSCLLEELFFLLLCCLTDEFILTVKSKQDEILRSLVQVLGAGSLTFSEIETQVPSALFDDPTFSNILQTVASLKISDKLHENGRYEISEVYLPQFIPFCFLQKRSKKEEALSYYKSRINGQTRDDFFSRMHIRAESRHFFDSEIFLHMLLVGLALNLLPDFGVGVVRKPFSYQLLDVILTTIALGVNVDTETIKGFKTRISINGNSSMINFVEMCLLISKDSDYQQFHDISAYIIGVISPELLNADEGAKESDQLQAHDDPKKQAALKRKAKLLEQFAVQQSTFAEANENALDSMDVESDLVDDQIGSGTCIICQETVYRGSDNEYGLVASSQYSKFLRHRPPYDAASLFSPLNIAVDHWRPGKEDNETMSNMSVAGCFISTCGHFMHVKCHEIFVRQQRAQRARGVTSSDVKDEFSCPLCKSFHNVLLPILAKNSIIFTARDSAVNVITSLADFRKYAKDVSSSLKMDDVIRESNPIGKFMTSIEKNVISQPIESADILQSELVQCDFVAEADNRNLSKELRDYMEKFTVYLECDPPISLLQTKLSYINDRQYSLWQALTYTLHTLVSTGLDNGNDKALIAIAELLIHQDCPRPRNKLKTILDTIASRFQSDDNEALPFSVGDPLELVVALASHEEGRDLLNSPQSLNWICIASTTRMLCELFRLGSFVVKDEFPQHAASSHIHALAETLIDSHYNRLKQVCGGFDALDIVVKMKKQTMFSLPADVLQRVSFTEMDRMVQCIDMLNAHCHGFLPSIWTSGNLRHAYNELFGTTLAPETISCAQEIAEGLAVASYDVCTGVELKKMTHIFQLLHMKDIPHWYWNHVFSFPIWPRKLDGYSLVNLPDSYQELLENALESSCQSCGTKLSDPILCLVCGRYICSGQSCCDMPTTTPDEHLPLCGGEVGLFLMAKKCRVLLIHKDKVIIYNAPYLDKHGETDINLRKGSPQFLHRKRYRTLQDIWLKQQIPSIIRRKLDQ